MVGLIKTSLWISQTSNFLSSKIKKAKQNKGELDSKQHRNCRRMKIIDNGGEKRRRRRICA